MNVTLGLQFLSDLVSRILDETLTQCLTCLEGCGEHQVLGGDRPSTNLVSAVVETNQQVAILRDKHLLDDLRQLPACWDVLKVRAFASQSPCVNVEERVVRSQVGVGCTVDFSRQLLVPALDVRRQEFGSDLVLTELGDQVVTILVVLDEVFVDCVCPCRSLGDRFKFADLDEQLNLVCGLVEREHPLVATSTTE